MMRCERPVTLSVSFADVLALGDVAELDRAADLGEDRRRERIPFDQLRAGFDLLALLHMKARTVRQRVTLLLAALGVGDQELAVTIDDDQIAGLALTVETLRKRTVPGSCLFRLLRHP